MGGLTVKSYQEEQAKEIAQEVPHIQELNNDERDNKFVLILHHRKH